MPATAGNCQQLSATAQHYAAQYYAASCMNCLSGRGTIPILCCPATCRVAEYTIVKIEPGVVIDGVRVPVTRSSQRRVNHALYCSERVPTSHHITLASHAHPV